MSSNRSVTHAVVPTCDHADRGRPRGLLGRLRYHGVPVAGWYRTVSGPADVMPAAALAGMSAATGSCTLAAASVLLWLGWLIDAVRDGVIPAGRAIRLAAARMEQATWVVGVALLAWALWCLAAAPMARAAWLPVAGVVFVAVGSVLAFWRDVARPQVNTLCPWPWPLAAWVAALLIVVVFALNEARLLSAAPSAVTPVFVLLALACARTCRRELDQTLKHA